MQNIQYLKVDRTLESFLLIEIKFNSVILYQIISNKNKKFMILDLSSISKELNLKSYYGIQYID